MLSRGKDYLSSIDIPLFRVRYEHDFFKEHGLREKVHYEVFSKPLEISRLSKRDNKNIPEF
ncbi:MAG TPA: hypothetical protein VJ208_02140 [Candidatus Nanoarchaeia archaeon]|nr:hypothetical protein [Candidatus Nanoarchaeia archaeon]